MRSAVGCAALRLLRLKQKKIGVPMTAHQNCPKIPQMPHHLHAARILREIGAKSSKSPQFRPYTHVVMPSRDRPKNSANTVGPKARLHPDSVAVRVPRIECLLCVRILLSPRSARPIAAWTRVWNVAVIDRIIDECKMHPTAKTPVPQSQRKKEPSTSSRRWSR